MPPITAQITPRNRELYGDTNTQCPTEEAVLTNPIYTQRIANTSATNSQKDVALGPEEAYCRGNPTKIAPTRATIPQLEQYDEIIRSNPNAFGVTSLMKIALSNKAPVFAASKNYHAYMSWKTSWEALFAVHIVDNPKLQVQVAAMSLQGDARDWWNAYWTTHQHVDITWKWFTELIKETFYPVEAQENAFTAWQDILFKGGCGGIL